jgi:hypothetical protein
MSGEDYAAHYTIKDGVLYVEKYNDSRRRTERHIYKL